jgi:prophage DNA circulation protein
MVDSLKTFNEGDKIFASETNSNNQYLLSKLSDNAAQVQTYVEGEISSIQSNVASVQATLQMNIDDANTNISNLTSTLFNKISPNFSSGQSLSSGATAPNNGWIYLYHKNTSDKQSMTAYINNKIVFQTGDSGTWSANLVASAFVPICKGETFKVVATGDWTATFYKCKGV